MSGFEKIKLATGEFRGEYIARRLTEKATAKQILAEINAPGFYSGEAGKEWSLSVIYAEQRRVKPKAEAKGETVAAPEVSGDVPAEYEGVLTPTDMAEIRAEAQAKITKKQREIARKAALVQATQDLEAEARLAAQRGVAKGDMVDIQIDIAPYAADLRLDGKSFMHGRVYRVPRKVYNTLQEMMQRSWQHQDGLSGKSDRPYRRSLADRGVTANNYQAAAVRV